MLVGLLRAVDICVVVGTGALVFAVYLGVTMDPVAELERYFLTSLLTAVLFVAGFHYIEGYALRQLSMLRWQLTRVAATWAVSVSVLLLVAFVGKVSETYSRGWMLGWLVTALAVMLIERGLARLAIA